MIQVLGCSKSEYGKGTKIRIALCAAATIAVVVLNVLLSVFRTDSTHIAFMAINIVADILLLWFLTGYSVIVLSLRIKLLKLASDTATREIIGQIAFVSKEIETYCGFSCYPVDILSDSGEFRIYAAANGAITFKEGEKVKVTTVNNIAVQAEAV